MVARGWGREKGKLVFNGIRFQFGEMKKSSRRMVAVTAQQCEYAHATELHSTDVENATFYVMYFLPQF